MKVKTKIDVWQFDPNVLIEAKPYIDVFPSVAVPIFDKCPEWLAELFPEIVITQQANNGLENELQMHLKLAIDTIFVIHSYDYIIRCKNKEIIMMTQKDFESLFGKYNL